MKLFAKYSERYRLSKTRRKKMPISKPKRSLRGLQNIKTISGRMDVLANPYKTYMKISILEMEKFRINKERVSALKTLEVIDQRCQEIEVEKKNILDGLEGQNVQQPCQRSPVVKTQTSHTNSDSFKIKY
jgi:hypothetical protein